MWSRSKHNHGEENKEEIEGRHTLSMPGVIVFPGAITFTRMLSLAHSNAKFLPSSLTAPKRCHTNRSIESICHGHPNSNVPLIEKQLY